jgi:hypothetical protein
MESSPLFEAQPVLFLTFEAANMERVGNTVRQRVFAASLVERSILKIAESEGELRC